MDDTPSSREGLFARLWRAASGNAKPGGSGGLTSAAAMRKVRLMIDEEKKDQEQSSAPAVPSENSPVLEPDYIASSPTMIETERETTARERAEESRNAQIKTLGRSHTINAVISFVLLMLAIVLLRQT